MLHVNFQPGLNIALPMVKALFLVTCQTGLTFRRHGYLKPVLTTGLKFELGYNSACFYHAIYHAT